MSSSALEVSVKLRSHVTCPHCWHKYSPEDTLWISQHPDLVNDPHLGADFQQRFLPSRFNVDGNAIDPRGLVCQDLACPSCHLLVPRAMFEMAPLFVSIMGTPSCGKSYFLASMTWQLRRTLPEYFAMAFSDADPSLNKMLNSYEEEQFFNPRQDDLVRLAKTEEQGDLYDTVHYGDRFVMYPRPFLFALRPLAKHPNQDVAQKISRVLCLYDNAGESFQPGKDTATNPVTRHLARSQALMFLFDPTQDPRFREACQGKTQDPQMIEGPVTSRQETILHEIAHRIRKHTGLAQHAKHPRPLFVIVTKYDAWSSLLGEETLDPPFVRSRNNDWYALDMNRIQEVSDRLRALLWKFSPELVSGAEGFSSQVMFLPASATGCGPELDPESGQMGIRPRDIKPIWVEVPLLYMLARWGGGMIPYKKIKKTKKKGTGTMWPPSEQGERS